MLIVLDLLPDPFLFSHKALSPNQGIPQHLGVVVLSPELLLHWLIVSDLSRLPVPFFKYEFVYPLLVRHRLGLSLDVVAGLPPCGLSGFLLGRRELLKALLEGEAVQHLIY
jgi:hypothetical protein